MTFSKPSDRLILDQIEAWGNDAMTYVIANRLRAQRYAVPTDWVRRQLQRLERLGEVERAPTGYQTQICWRIRRPTP